jgi:hypothetical protein
MEAYEWRECPYCQATGNPPGARFCAKCHLLLPSPPPIQPLTPPTGPANLEAAEVPADALPFHLVPPIRGDQARSPLIDKRKLVALGGALGATVLLEVVILPLLAYHSADAATAAFAAAAAHQPAVHAAVNDWLTGRPLGKDWAAADWQAATSAESDELQTALNRVRSDESRLNEENQTLGLLDPITLIGHDRLGQAKPRVAVALDGLKQIDNTLSLAINDVQLDNAALKLAQDYEAIAFSLHNNDLARAQTQLQGATTDAESAARLARNPGEPPAVRDFVGNLRDLVSNTSILVDGALRNDSVTVMTYGPLVRQGVDQFARGVGTDWIKWLGDHYRPKLAAYDKAMSR